MCHKGVKLKWQNFMSLSCRVLELLRKNPRGQNPSIDRVEIQTKSASRYSPGVRTKKWLILGVSLTDLVKSRDLFLLEAEIFDNIFQRDVLKNMRQIKSYDDLFQTIRALTFQKFSK